MTDAQFQAILNATQDYSTLTIPNALAILSGTDAYYRSLLSSEINAAWNGDDANPGPGGLMGDAIYNNPGSSLDGWTVDAINQLAFTTLPENASADLIEAITYLGAGGEFDSISTCLATPPSC